MSGNAGPERRTSDTKSLERLLEDLESDVPGTAENLMPYVYAELRSLAARYMRRQGVRHTLQPTALVHEAYLRMVGGRAYRGREHFLAVAARAMRHVLVDHARRRKASKRGGGQVVLTLEEGKAPAVPEEIDLLALEEGMKRLQRLDSRHARIVEMRFFTGLTVEEIGRVLGLSTSTVYADLAMAQAWLSREVTR